MRINEIMQSETKIISLGSEAAQTRRNRGELKTGCATLEQLRSVTPRRMQRPNRPVT
jgi:hypothetical protein